MCPSKSFLQLVQLVTCEGGPVPPLLPAGQILVVHSAAGAGAFRVVMRQVWCRGRTRFRDTHCCQYPV